MITFSNTLKAILALPVVETFYMVDIGGNKTTDYFTNVILSNNDVYVSDGKLIQVDPPQLSASVDRQQYKIALADPNFEYGTMTEAGIVGMPVTVRLGVVNVDTGVPYTNVEDTIIVYKGRIDAGAYDVDTQENGRVVFKLVCSSPMADLDLVRTVYTSKSSLKNISASDVSFAQVYEGSGQIQLRWGKG